MNFSIDLKKLLFMFTVSLLNSLLTFFEFTDEKG